MSVHEYLGIDNRWQLGYACTALQRAAQRYRANLYIAHSEAAMAAAVGLQRNGWRVGLDMEDWFSEDLLPEARRHRPLRLLRSLESELLVKGAYASCPSNALSEALANEYGCAPPSVIYNAFQRSKRKSLDGLLKDPRDRRIRSIHWFSQTSGRGRGLEDLIAALPLLEHEVEIHLRGIMADGFESWLWTHVPEHWHGRIILHDLVHNDDLLSRIAEHDIGFAGEMKYCRSRDLTVTNKILYYLMAGLAVVASDTAGQSEVAHQAPEAVHLYPSGIPSALATRLNALLGSPKALRHAKAAALEAAERTFCWEQQEDVLLGSITRALNVEAKGPKTDEKGHKLCQSPSTVFKLRARRKNNPKSSNCP